jgi:hypothetical protein
LGEIRVMIEGNWQQYLSFTPKDGGEYYTLSIPVGVQPPQEDERMVLDGVNVVVSFISTPEEIAKGRGGPVARSMRENGIAYRVNCLPEGHKWLQRTACRVKVASDKVGKCTVFLPPEKFDLKAEGKMSVFLAGAIDMGAAEDWQKAITEYLSDVACVVLNPRRKDWDSTWKQEMENPKFNEQVSWELKGLEECSLIALCFTKESKAPISLLEMGLHIGDGRMIVFCPEGYWRKGNVDIVCQRYGVPVLADWTDFKKEVHRRMLLPSTVVQKSERFVMASDRMAWRVLAKEFVMTMHTAATMVKPGDICTVDVKEAMASFGPVGMPHQSKILRDIIRQGGGKVEVDSAYGLEAHIVAYNNPVSKMMGGVNVPFSALRVVGHNAGFVPIKTVSEKREEERRRRETQPTHIPKKSADEGVDPMAGEKMTSLFLKFQTWATKEIDKRPMSAPVSVQIMDGMIAVRKAVESKMSLHGSAAVRAFANAMEKHFTLDAPPFPELSRKYGRTVIRDIFYSMTATTIAGMGDPLRGRPDYGERDGMRVPTEGIMTGSDNIRVRAITDRMVAKAKEFGNLE